MAGTAAPTTQKIAAASDDDAKQLLADTEQVVCVLGLQLADHSKHQETIQKVQQALIQSRTLPFRLDTAGGSVGSCSDDHEPSKRIYMTY